MKFFPIHFGIKVSCVKKIDSNLGLKDMSKMSGKSGSHVPNRRRNTAGKTHMLPPLNTTNNTNNQLVNFL